MTCGTHEAAASSTIPRRQGIKIKKGNSQKLIRVKNKYIKGNLYCS
jgi:hypothetical protein